MPNNVEKSHWLIELEKLAAPANYKTPAHRHNPNNHPSQPQTGTALDWRPHL
jgi:hypothetical protein